MDDVILSIDCGTQSLRGMLFDVNGRLLAKEKIEYEPYYSEKPGWAEQDAMLYWDTLCKACLKLKKENLDIFSKIAGVGVTAMRDTMVNIDKDGNPLRPTINWLDIRKAEKVYEAKGFERLGYEMVGMWETLAKIQKDGKSNWIMQNEPDIWKKTYKYIMISGFLNYKLTANFIDSIASQIGHLPFDYKNFRWANKNSYKFKLFPIELDKLTDTAKPGDELGKITTEASKQTGIAEGVRVIACGSDKGCETIGMGCIDESMVNLSFGTTATVQTTTERYYEAIRFMPPYCAPIPGRYNPEVQIYRGYWMINWFKREIGTAEALEAREKGIAPELALNQLLNDAPPGSMGLVTQPHWTPGLRHPFDKGAIIGFGDIHKKAYIYRSVIEGLAFALLKGTRQIEKAARRKITLASVSGGASQSDEICKISADIFNLPLVRGATFETSGLGAAIVTAVGLGIYQSFNNAIKNMVEYKDKFLPDQKNVGIYKNLFERVYLKMDKALRPLYNEIRDITGYPEKA